MTRFLGVWRCSVSCNGSFQIIIVFPWKSQLDPSALPSISLSSSALLLQPGFLVSFSYCTIQSCLIPFSQVQTLSCLFTLSPPFYSFAGSSSQTLLLSFPQSLPHLCFMFWVFFIPFILTTCHPSCPCTAFLFTQSSVTQPFNSNWRESPAPLSPLQAAARGIPPEHGLCSMLVLSKRDHTSQKLCNLLRLKLPPSKVSTVKVKVRKIH